MFCRDCGKELGDKRTKRCRQCDGILRRKTQIRTKQCEVCATTIHIRNPKTGHVMNGLLWERRRFCSNKCKGFGMKKEADLEVYCWNCNDPIPNKVGYKRYKDQIFCNRKCHLEFMKQPNSQLRIRANKFKKPWRPTVFQKEVIHALYKQNFLYPKVLIREEKVSLTRLKKHRFVKLHNGVWQLTQLGHKYAIQNFES